MPRPLLGPQNRSTLDVGPATRARGTTRTGTSGGPVLSTPRSADYLAAIGKLDASATLAAADLAEIVDTLHREFAEKWAAVPLGYVGHCYLGPPYEAHTLTVAGQIIEHYETGRPLPGPLERARALARTDHYRVIEVYLDRLVCVNADGTATVVGGS